MQSASPSPSPPSSVDALQLLREDHRRVARLFDEFESLQSEQRPDRQRLVQVVQDIGAELTLHAQLEEEVFYPAVEQATGERQFVEHARTEHQHTRDLMRALAGMQIDDPRLPATVRDLSGAVSQHVREEEENLFPHAQGRLDVQAVGQQLAQRRRQLESPSGDGPVENDGDMGLR